MPFTLGVNTASLAGYSLEDALSIAATLGFQAVELLAYEGATHSQGRSSPHAVHRSILRNALIRRASESARPRLPWERAYARAVGC